MKRFQVVNGIKKEEIDYCTIYSRNLVKATNERTQQLSKTGTCDKNTLKKIVLFGVKFVNQLNNIDSYEGLLAKFQIISGVKEVISELTPRELMTVFPIAKEYKGKKYGSKDYFFTMEAINEIGIDTKIGENVSEFLFNYHDYHDIFEFVVSSMTVISEIRRQETGKGMIEEFFPDMKTYTMHETHDGKKVMIDNQTGETTEVKKPIPRYLKVVE